MTELLTSALDADTSGVPFAITNRRLIPAQRYYDKGFFELESGQAVRPRACNGPTRTSGCRIRRGVRSAARVRSRA